MINDLVSLWGLGRYKTRANKVLTDGSPEAVLEQRSTNFTSYLASVLARN